MKTEFLVITGLTALFGFIIIPPAHALEFESLTVKDTDNTIVSTGIVGQPVIFETTITNNEDDADSFEIAFTTRTVNDKILDHQKQHIILNSGETKTISYKFIPSAEGNYVSGIFYGEQPFSDIITFPVLYANKTYPQKTVLIYSDPSGDCVVACMYPSVLNVDVGTIVIWNNTTHDIRHISTGNYVEDKDGISWSSTDGFHSTIIPERESSFLFSQPGEYQLFLAEHRTQDVIGTVHVMSDQFREADKTFNILNKIMNDDEFGIPISSLHINPKNSVITVGINDKRNSLFTLDVYKTMLYKQVGNVYLNIMSDHNSPKWCDVNDEVAVKAMLNKDPVVKQFLQNYPYATFEHFKTSDEPGNPRTYSEFRHELFLLRVLVLTFDQNDVCYPVYGYVVGYDDRNYESKKELFENIYSKSDGISEPINEIKNLSKPYNQIKSDISINDIQCKDGFVKVVKKSNDSPVCVKPETKTKLIERGWLRTSTDMLSSKHEGISDVEKLLIENQIEYVPEKLVVTTGPVIKGDPGCGAVVDVNSNTYWFGVDSVSNPARLTLFDENPNQCKVNTSSCFCNAQIELSSLTLDKLGYFTQQEQEEYTDILIDYMYKENINRTPKFMIGKHNVNYTDSSAIGYCGKIWGTNTYGYFDGAIVNGKVEDYGISKDLSLLCAIDDNSQYFGKIFGEK